MKSDLCKGELIKWKDEKGFGFIKLIDENKEIFLHITELKDSIRRPQVGDIIYFKTTTENGKIKACDAFILGARTLPNSQYSVKKIISNRANFPLLEVLLLSIIPLIGSINFFSKTNIFFPLIIYPIISLLTFFLYAHDKSRAKLDHRRIPEKTLHLLEFFGGWIGGFIAQRTLKHKSIKSSYQFVFWLIVIIHEVMWLVWLFVGEKIKNYF